MEKYSSSTTQMVSGADGDPSGRQPRPVGCVARVGPRAAAAPTSSVDHVDRALRLGRRRLQAGSCRGNVGTWGTQPGK
jgi:hypothetical protein